ncbi:MAG: LeuD/DmdB family oxidoreductase small subunit [Candidatus Ranarchaeia archaeon]
MPKNTNVVYGRTWLYGDNIDTDQIFPGRYLALLDPFEMAKHAMEGVPGNLSYKKFGKGDIIVAGSNFGSGSSREHAPLSLAYRGIALVLAESFGPIFYRNAVNIGLPIMEIPDKNMFSDGDHIEVHLDTGQIINRTQDKKAKASPISKFELAIIEAGGLIPFIKQAAVDNG